MTDSYGDIDEVEEEALLKSDEDDYAASHEHIQQPLVINEDSLLNEAAELDEDDDVDGMEQELSDEDIDNEDNDDDGDEDDDDMDEVDKALKEYQEIITELQNNQYLYNKYVKLCELSHAIGDLDYIRQAYDTFASVYPLASNFWLKYISIEVNVAITPTEIEHVDCLFKKALADYFSVEIGMEYAIFAARTSDPGKTWNEILGTYGPHCMNGQQFYKLYREYINKDSTKSAEEKQQLYIDSYLRELKYPLFNMEETYIEFKVFYEKNKTLPILNGLDWTAIDNDYFKAKEHLQKILPYERQLEALDSKCYRERADVYTNYIKESDKFLDENILQTIYERMVTDCCLNEDCWLTYIDFVEYRDEFGRPKELQDFPLFLQSSLDVNKRALRNCTWSDKLYIKRMNLMEIRERPREEIQNVLENSVSAGFQTAEPAVAIWTEYLTYLRRHTNWENEEECDILRKNFNLAWTILGQQWGVLADCNCEILKFWGRLEYGPLDDQKRGKELWTTVMESADNATQSGLWIEFIQMEMRRDLESTRKLYRKALHSTGLDNPMVIISAWERFERCNGNIKTLNNCLKETTEFQLNYQAQFKTEQQRQHQHNDEKSPKILKRKSTATSERDSREKKMKFSPKDVSFKKPKEIETPKKCLETEFKEHENQEIDMSKDHLRIFLSNLDYSLSEDNIKEALGELQIIDMNLIRSANGKSRGFGYAELKTEMDVERALAMDRRTINGRPVYISSVLRDKEKRQKFKYSAGLEPKKLFIKSLPHDVTKEEIIQIFSKYGEITDVRLVYHKSGKFKNIAYVEYADETSASKALMVTDGMALRDHNIQVAISAPPPKSNAPSANPLKKMGMGAKLPKVFEQKLRMSLIPNVVRKNLTVTKPTPPPAAAVVVAANGSPAAATTTKAVAASKTNADFRKLLEKPS